MTYFNKISRIILLLWLAVVAHFSCADGGEEYFIVLGVKSLVKLESEPRLSPWLIENNEKSELSEGDFDEVNLYSSGCHFYEVTYFSESLSGTSLDIQVRFQPGEFCDVSIYMFSQSSLIKVKRWGGKYYLEAFAKTKHGNDGSQFIVGEDVIREFGVDSLYAKLENIESACEDLKYISEVELNRMLSDSTIVRSSPDTVCYNKGVYINSLENYRGE